MKYLVENFEFDTEKGSRQIEGNKTFIYSKDETYDIEEIMVVTPFNVTFDFTSQGGIKREVGKKNIKTYEVYGSEMIFKEERDTF